MTDSLQAPDKSRKVLMDEDLFLEFVELVRSNDPTKVIDIEWGPAHYERVVYYSPVIFEMSESDDQETLALATD